MCQQWLEHSTLSSVKQHLSLLSCDVDLADCLLGAKSPRTKRFAYASYNEFWKLPRQKWQHTYDKLIKII